MYVTQTTFEKANEVLKGGITALSGALTAVRDELSEHIGIVDQKVDESRLALEMKVDESRVALERKVEDEVGDVKGEVNEVQTMVRGLEEQLLSIEEVLEGAKQQRQYANRGISLLCKTVSELSFGGNSTSSTLENDDLDAVQKELRRFSVTPAPEGGATPISRTPTAVQSHRRGRIGFNSKATRQLHWGNDSPAEMKKTFVSSHAKMQALQAWASKNSGAFTISSPNVAVPT